MASKDPAKRPRYDESKMEVVPPGNWAEAAQLSAFRPWSPTVLNALKEGKLPRDG